MTDLKRIAIGMEGHNAIPMSKFVAKIQKKMAKIPKGRRHPMSRCRREEEPCAIHSPSDHHMAHLPYLVRYDKHAVVERICPHGVGHPDPDSVAWVKRRFGDEAAVEAGTHGCWCKCCEVPGEAA